MASPAFQIDQIVDIHRRQLAGLVEVRGARGIRRMYQRARDELEDKLRRMARAGRGKTFEAHHVRQVLVQVAAAVADVEGGIGSHLEDTGPQALKLAPRHVVDTVHRLEGHFGGLTPVIDPAQAAVFLGGDDKVPPSLLNHYRSSAKFYGEPVVKKIRDQLSLAVIQGEGVDDAVDRVVGTDGVFTGARWRAERIVRTEMAYSYGVAKQAGMVELKKQVPKLKKKLVETFDVRTGEDSKQLHGQTVDVDQPFVWKVKNSKGQATGEVIYYMQPPNRPNDRGITISWMDGWPAYPTEEPGPVRP